MPKKQKMQPMEEIRDLVKKYLILELFKINVPQAQIGKKLRVDLAAVNNFLKGIKKHQD